MLTKNLLAKKSVQIEVLHVFLINEITVLAAAVCANE
jgi:hypothetical protein